MGTDGSENTFGYGFGSCGLGYGLIVIGAQMQFSYLYEVNQLKYLIIFFIWKTFSLSVKNIFTLT
jgi:hypothetical protein